MANVGGGRTALITGASSGIGEAYARRLAGDGFNLVLVARRKKVLEELADELSKAYKVNVDVEAADLCNDADVARLVELIGGSGSLEMLINNAGFITSERFIDADLERQLDMVRVHDVATMRLTKAALDVMRAGAGGKIINVSSIAGLLPAAYNATYNASKAFLVGLTEGLFQELTLSGEKRIRLQVLCPGYTHTGFHEAAGADRAGAVERAWMTAGEVVEESLAGLEKGKLVCIPGAKNRALAWFMYAMPRRVRYVLLRTVVKED